MAAKKIIQDWSETGKTAYCIIRRESDNYRLNDADGSFAFNPADPYLTLTEDSVIKGRYEASESRTAWGDGIYTVVVFKQTGGSPAPVSDTIIGSGELYIVNDIEIALDASVAAVKAKTDNLPVDPADQSTVEVAITSAQSAIIAEVNANETKLDTIAGYIDTEITSIINALSAVQADIGDPSVDTTTIYAQVLAVKTYVDDLEARLTATRAGLLDNLDAAISSRAVEANVEAHVTASLNTSLISGGAFSPGILQSRIMLSGSSVSIVRGDVVTLTFNLGSAWNLTGKKVFFIAKKIKTDSNTTAIVNRECTITDAANGACKITLAETETTPAGNYYAEVEVRDIDETNPQTARQFIFKINQDVRQ